MVRMVSSHFPSAKYFLCCRKLCSEQPDVFFSFSCIFGCELRVFLVNLDAEHWKWLHCHPMSNKLLATRLHDFDFVFLFVCIDLSPIAWALSIQWMNIWTLKSWVFWVNEKRSLSEPKKLKISVWSIQVNWENCKGTSKNKRKTEENSGGCSLHCFPAA